VLYRHARWRDPTAPGRRECRPRCRSRIALCVCVCVCVCMCVRACVYVCVYLCRRAFKHGCGASAEAAAAESDAGSGDGPTSFELPDGTVIEAETVAAVPDALFESSVDAVRARGARGRADARAV
jgi:hypothetical protein